MDRLLLVCLGSALGGGARYLISLGMLRWLGAGFPYGTLTVNVVGSFLIGLVMQIGLTTTVLSPNTRLFLTTGILGGFTTYSTFNYETLALMLDAEWRLAAVNLTVTALVCLLAGFAGLAAGRALVGT